MNASCIANVDAIGEGAAGTKLNGHAPIAGLGDGQKGSIGHVVPQFGAVNVGDQPSCGIVGHAGRYEALNAVGVDQPRTVSAHGHIAASGETGRGVMPDSAVSHVLMLSLLADIHASDTSRVLVAMAANQSRVIFDCISNNIMG